MEAGTSWLADEPRFKEGVSIVTGGSGGIGREIALTLARAGSDVVLTYGRNKKAAEEVARQITAMGRKAEIAALAIENSEDVSRFVNDVASRHSVLHSVVYASGPGLHMELIGDIDPSNWAKVIAVDVNGCFNLVHATLPHVRKARGAYLAVITAAVERVPVRDIQSAAPKAAIEMLMRGVAKEEGRNGVRANCVGPGWIRAGLGQHAIDNELTPEAVAAITKGIPLRTMGEARDIADAALFLLSSRARFVTGQSLAVDGGMQA
ncbi:SDR family NAD(P)-dependent oxidoreductase [Paraburkholderia rhynchosiae]|uniref:3-oxoacyl-[acyl-carrier-protein] reductase FabG n=1 Tax=Paraburkholderia rhynchosiae TaxID=487049 RepID=A0A2N7W549_9BURK|nr:SDR family oxidoreductase [Paraburkholderia rhynchosiae]PMS24527.1 short-chain dehydrogenase [Paraburkholderia rhynchosiae]CAB3735656.1 3-oxoacyl-[acyl-carrier-protein] reductase FabG [Paraburkholderia rhynchosiae]